MKRRHTNPIESSPPKTRRVGKLTQLGGHTGSTAGDAAIFSLEDSRKRFQIDGGSTAQKVRATALAKTLNERKQSAAGQQGYHSEGEASDDEEIASPPQKLVKRSEFNSIALNTHSHADHVLDPAVFAFTQGVFHGLSLDSKIPEGIRTAVGKNNEILFRWRSKIPLTSGRKMQFEARVIMPDVPPSVKDQNAKSLGVLIKADAVTPDKKDPLRTFTYYSLGDMTGKGQSAVQAAFEADKDGSGAYRFPDLIKLPHHGSKSNLDAIPAGMVGPNTKVIVSGYTNSVPRDVLKKWKTLGINPKNVTIIFDDATHQQLIEAIGGSSSQAKVYLDAGVKVARDCEVVFLSDGTATIAVTDLFEPT